MNILSLLFITWLLSVFVTGILLLLVLTERNRLQLVLASTLGVFGMVALLVLIGMIQDSEYTHAILSSPFRFRTLVLGLIVFLGAMGYYMVASRRNLFTLRNGGLFAIPLLLTLIVYVSWHWGAGVPMDYAYSSLSEMWENIFTIPVILRVLLFLFFLIYQGAMIYIMWYPDITSREHHILNASDAVSNIRWLHRVDMGIMALLAVYLLLVFVPSAWAYAIFCIATASVFVYFIYNACARRMYEATDGWQANWTPRDGWKIIEGTSKPETKKTVEAEAADNTQPSGNIDYIPLIERWMKGEKPFCKPDFSMANITTQFPDCNHETLQELLRKDGGRGQAYIRRHRIEEACRIIRREKEVKVMELAPRVGFSHTSSFSRAFSTVMGETILQYMNKVGAKRKPKKKAKKRTSNKSAIK